MVKFVGIKINFDDRALPFESKYAVPIIEADYQKYIERYENTGKGGWGFHECLNFRKIEGEPVQMYLPPTGIPADIDCEYVIFSFTYQSDEARPSSVLGVHGAARLVDKEGISRPGIAPIKGISEFMYHVEADENFVTLFSSPLSYDPRENFYTPQFEKWGNGLRYISPVHAANILDSALAQASRDMQSGSESYRRFVQRGIETIKQIRRRYGFETLSSPKANVSKPSAKKGGSLPDKVLGEKGERLVYERERKLLAEHGLGQNNVSWASQSIPNLPYDIETVRLTNDGIRPHFIEVKSTTQADLTNIYVSQQQIEHMKANQDASSLVVILFGQDGKKLDEWEFSVDDLLGKFEFLPIKFKLSPLRPLSRHEASLSPSVFSA